MKRLHQDLLILSAILASWLAMQDVHEFGHVAGAWLSGGHVQQVVIHPLTISRTDIADNRHPLLVVWSGPMIGVTLPLTFWVMAALAKLPGAFLLRFFAGFCLIANGAYIGFGSFDGIGDCGEMLRHSCPIWTLWLFGAIAVPAGLWLWHRQGPHFGLGRARGRVDHRMAYVSVAALVTLVVLGLVVDGR